MKLLYLLKHTYVGVAMALFLNASRSRSSAGSMVISIIFLFFYLANVLSSLFIEFDSSS